MSTRETYINNKSWRGVSVPQQATTRGMFASLISGLALLGAAIALPNSADESEAIDGTFPYLPVNDGWVKFPFGNVGSVTPIVFELLCSGRMNITDLYCSGDQFAIYDNGVFLGNTSDPVFNNCSSNSSSPDFTQNSPDWSHGSFPYCRAGITLVSL